MVMVVNNENSLMELHTHKDFPVNSDPVRYRLLANNHTDKDFPINFVPDTVATIRTRFSPCFTLAPTGKEFTNRRTAKVFYEG